MPVELTQVGTGSEGGLYDTSIKSALAPGACDPALLEDDTGGTGIDTDDEGDEFTSAPSSPPPNLGRSLSDSRDERSEVEKRERDWFLSSGFPIDELEVAGGVEEVEAIVKDRAEVNGRSASSSSDTVCVDVLVRSISGGELLSRAGLRDGNRKAAMAMRDDEGVRWWKLVRVKDSMLNPNCLVEDSERGIDTGTRNESRVGEAQWWVVPDTRSFVDRA